MHPIDHGFSLTGGFLRRRDLLALGMRDHALRQHVRSGDLIRIRHGWYAPGAADHEAAARAAVRVGGRLTGFSALRTYGVWTPDLPTLEVAVPRNAKALRDPGRMRVRLAGSPREGATRIHWVAGPVQVDRSVWRVRPIEALATCFRTGEREHAVIVADSCVHLALLARSDVNALTPALPAERRSWVSLVDGRAESGGETAVRLRLAEAGIRFLPQPAVPGVGHLDGQIGRRTYVEVDGFESHGTKEGFEEDRRRDLVSRVWNHQVVRITSKQVFADWTYCLEAIRAALATD
ncbi:MAG: type IV toxin-antitoxin system AbiEi family antitoxin domain-containing protein [Herbiconiux sp.]|nr:type IV toxin-antitoxin system AbiEi family antitoxin domain-containing protein [Herbiconiux sp.]